MPTPIDIRAALSFLDLTSAKQGPELHSLSYALDKLAVAYHEAPDGSPSEGDCMPPRSASIRKDLAERLPEFGYYPVAAPDSDLMDRPLIAHALDDLDDLNADLAEVIWRFDHLGEDDAHWWFKFSFRTHWGRHLRHLSLYIHSRQFD